MDKLKARIRNLLQQQETGLPAIAALIAPADGSELPTKLATPASGGE